VFSLLFLFPSNLLEREQVGNEVGGTTTPSKAKAAPPLVVVPQDVGVVVANTIAQRSQQETLPPSRGSCGHVALFFESSFAL